LPEEGLSGVDTERLGTLVGARLFASTDSIARRDPVTLRSEAPLAEAFSRAARHGFRPMPISDSHGRLVGVFDELAMLRGLTKLLQAEQEKLEGPPSAEDRSELAQPVPLT